MLLSEGTSSALLASASPLLSDGNELLGCVITLTDIIERKRAEEALAIQADELARSNSDLRQFAYSANHDLRAAAGVFIASVQTLKQALHAMSGIHGMLTGVRTLLGSTLPGEKQPEKNSES